MTCWRYPPPVTSLQELWLVDGVGADGDAVLQPSRCSAARSAGTALNSGRSALGT
jgi:hypothetical protein